MELRQLRYFTEVLQSGSFAVAATKLGVTQPALSKSMRSLEASLGAELLDRGPQGVRPTIYGEHFAAYAHLVLGQVAEARQEIEALLGARAGWLRLGAVPSTLRAIVPHAISSFLAERPNVRLSVIEGPNDSLLEALRQGKLDLVVTAMPLDPYEPDIEHFELSNEPMTVVCGTKHPLANEQEITIEQLSGFDWVVPPTVDPDRRRLDLMFTAAGLSPPRVVIETTSVILLQSIVANNPYLSYLPSSKGVDSRPEFVSLPFTSPGWRRVTVIAHRRRGPVRPLLRGLITSLRKADAAKLASAEATDFDPS